MYRQGLGKLANNFINKIKSFTRSWQGGNSFIRNIFDCDFPQNIERSGPKVEESGSSDKLNPFKNNFNNLHEIGPKNPNRLIFAHINKNCLGNKFEMLQEIIGNSKAWMFC